MNVTLKPITKDNWRHLHMLSKSLSAEQKNFVAPNTFSILEALFEPEKFTAWAVYEEDTPVGFLMTAFDSAEQNHWIVRLMIGADYQGNGYGRQTMRLAIGLLKTQPDCHEIYISFEPDNDVARGLYSSLGFVDTGQFEHEEMVYRLSLFQDEIG